MRDRQPTKPGRVRLTPENGTAPFYAVMEMADEPTDLGTPPTKANLLTDATEAALFGAAADRTVNEALAGIAGELQKLGIMAKIESGTYVGTGKCGADNPNTLTFSFQPKIVFLLGYDMRHFVMAYGHTAATNNDNYPVTITWSGNTVSWYSGQSAHYQGNMLKATYYYVAFG